MTDSAVNESQTLANGIVHTVLTSTINSYGKGKFRPVPRRIETWKPVSKNLARLIMLLICVLVSKLVNVTLFSEHPFRLLAFANSPCNVDYCQVICYADVVPYCIVSCVLRASANNESGVKSRQTTQFENTRRVAAVPKISDKIFVRFLCVEPD